MEDAGQSPFEQGPSGSPPVPDGTNPYASPQSPYAPAYPPVTPSRTSNEAVIALVLAVTGLLLTVGGCVFPLFCCMTLPLEAVAVVLALVARSKMAADPTLGGRGLANAALVIGILSLLLYVGLVAVGVLGGMVQ